MLANQTTVRNDPCFARAIREVEIPAPGSGHPHTGPGFPNRRSSWAYIGTGWQIDTFGIDAIRAHLQCQHWHGDERFRYLIDAHLGRRAVSAKIARPRKGEGLNTRELHADPRFRCALIARRQRS